MTGKITKYLDLRGLKCPLPVLKTRSALKAMAAGAILEVATSDPMAVIDLPHLLAQTGDTLLAQTRTDSGTVFRIEKRPRASGEQP